MSSVEVTINGQNAIDIFDTLSKSLQDIIDTEILRFLFDIKEYALLNRKWQNRTGALEASHFIEPTHDGWRLRVDPREASGKPFNYAYALEKGHLRHYAWIAPALSHFEGELDGRINNAFKEFFKKQGVTTKHFQGGKERTVVRHPAGAVDPITGERIGGRFI